MVWDGQKLYYDCDKLLMDNGFVMLAIKAAWPQSDSVWVCQDVFHPNW